ncbi:MAG: DUF952 domain-containing protein [Pseudomonadota bacterium]
MRVMKVLRLDEANAFDQSGTFNGSPDDQRDGFIHLSTEDQLAGTVARHFSDDDGVIAEGLTVYAFEAETLGEMLRWEASRGGALFPHLYGALDAGAIVTRYRIAGCEREKIMLEELG